MRQLLRQLDQFLGDYVPPATRKMMYILVAAFVAMNLLLAAAGGAAWGGWVRRAFVLRPDQFLLQGNLWQAFTYMLGHSGAMHLLGNLIGLGIFGGMVEERLGVRRYWWFAMIAGVTAALVHVAVAFVLGRSEVGLMGFSAAVLAMLVAAAMWFPRQQIMVMLMFPIPLGILALLYGAFLMLSMVEDIRTFNLMGNKVSTLAHLVGFLMGIIMVKNPGILDRLEFVHIPFLTKKRRKPARVLSMGHPGRHSDPDDRYNDPHWFLDQ